MTEIAYEDRYVAFIDILGFKAHTKRAGSDPEFLRKLVKALGELKDGSQYGHWGTSDLRSHHFSDCIILSAESHLGGLSQITRSLFSVARALFHLGIYVRGGLTHGQIFHSAELAFGPAVNRAYELESKIASFPRIVLDKSILGHHQKYCEEEDGWEAHYSKEILRDVDGVWFVHFLWADESFDSYNEGGEIETEPKPMRMLQEQIDSTMTDPGVFRKLNWLADYWNFCVDSRAGKDSPDGRIRVKRRWGE